MRRYSDSKPISSIIRREEKTDPTPEYQRGPVWSKKQKQLLIDTILRDLDIPKFYIRTVNNGQYEWEVVDGQQRLRAIWEFKKGLYKIAKDADPVNNINIANLSYNDMSEDFKDKFESYTLDIVELADATQDEVAEMFLRLQNGSTLKAAEKRNALPGEMKDFIRELAKHDFFNNCDFKNKRFDFDQVAAQCMLLELNGGVRNIKNTDLEKMYLENDEFDFESVEAKKINKVLNYLTRTFPEKTPGLKQGNVISLYIIISMLSEKYAISELETKIGKWFIDFETKRSADLDLPEDQRDSEMVAYQNAVGHSSDSIESLEYRNKILVRDFFSTFNKILPLDGMREFSYEQKLAIFRRDKGFCQLKKECTGKKLGWDDDWHADHKIPFSKGGLTTVENGQVLCADCNLSKSNN
ncbi:MAG: hypothetical protein A2908_02300 [Candidatus Staskawiczbacteria bacterium RIFCSPLOWO2_01_FULL_38_12b]|uniref:HNH nuclease domain-containing protein n=1 Tax=Candidatus Staskawiczbacteria bacterium RIFCSPLOWO2_01_FULL_38_12b TaxID=1802214 RepID=A0A1G2IBU2_9BACT|nr:MAG: hypothetical protein A2908_02300 [Candidatus Staskawiczbacteria bacterium RIFCSPLOWO2_01_FULL_38_12b]